MEIKIEVKKRPIIFNTEMVQAILDGRKTQTRRVIKNPEKLEGLMLSGEEENWCPYGKIGDRLWVRETWANILELSPEKNLVYKATDWKGWLEYEVEPIKWSSPLFMPRWASRITLEITNIRVERLQDITEEDAEAEGISWSHSGGPFDNPEIIGAIENFAYFWDSLNAKRGYPWDSNPWVWVIEFKKI